jgi:hypothetical protein
MPSERLKVEAPEICLRLLQLQTKLPTCPAFVATPDENRFAANLPSVVPN